MKGEIEKGVFSMDNDFQQAWNKCVASIWKACLHFTQNTHDAEDLMQTTWVKSYVNWKKHQPTSLKKAYFSTIARNIWIDELRKKKLPIIPYEDYEKQIADSTSDILSQNLVHLLNQLVSKLTINQQIFFLLADVCKCSLKEIAQLTNVSIGAVKANLFRARQKVKDEVRKSLDFDSPIDEDQVLRIQLYTYALQNDDVQLLANLLTDNASVRALYAQRQHTPNTMESKMAA